MHLYDNKLLYADSYFPFTARAVRAELHADCRFTIRYCMNMFVGGSIMNSVYLPASFTAMRDALNATGRPMLYSIHSPWTHKCARHVDRVSPLVAINNVALRPPLAPTTAPQSSAACE